MISPRRILVFQTAFLGDVILTLPMVQQLKKKFPDAEIDFVAIPKATGLLSHPAIASVIPYDKRNSQKGVRGILSFARLLRQRNYDIAIVPHRSLRSSLVVALSSIPVRIGFSNASGSRLFTSTVPYRPSDHEVERNNALLRPLGIDPVAKELPSLFPSESDKKKISKLLFEREVVHQDKMIAIAPGSVWNTKRWLIERYAALAFSLAEHGFELHIIGGNEDRELGRAIVESAKHKHVHDLTGRLTLLESAELIARCRTLVTNDSAPLHIGVAMRTPVVAIFGATVPEFGFAPYGKHDAVIEIKGLSCRPCAIHGGHTCPIRTFDCMKKISAERVFEVVLEKATLSKD